MPSRVLVSQVQVSIVTSSKVIRCLFNSLDWSVNNSWEGTVQSHKATTGIQGCLQRWQPLGSVPCSKTRVSALTDWTCIHGAQKIDIYLMT